MIKILGEIKVRCRFTCVKCNARLESDDFYNDVSHNLSKYEVTYHCPNCGEMVTHSYKDFNFNFETEEYVKEIKDESND